MGNRETIIRIMRLIPFGRADTLKCELPRRILTIAVGVQPLGCPGLVQGEARE